MAFEKVAEPGEIQEGGVKPVEVAGRPVALTCHEGRFGALDGRCPHMGGPLGEGAIEYGLLVCPWHGREFHPLTGECQSHQEHLRSYPVEVRDDGIYVDASGNG
jgi:pyruvate oxidase